MSAVEERLDARRESAVEARAADAQRAGADVLTALASLDLATSSSVELGVTAKGDVTWTIKVRREDAHEAVAIARVIHDNFAHRYGRGLPLPDPAERARPAMRPTDLVRQPCGFCKGTGMVDGEWCAACGGYAVTDVAADGGEGSERGRLECPATGGEHVWTDAVGPEHEHYPQDWRIHCDECGASPPKEDAEQ
jgi:hypothetical protein